ncbi:hypothetical protein BBO99_00006519 [Phytophthora kernoviae]|uniref:Uncharacterized protein n=2 Tax=Phytophthora kernoviae TaxID=325452 RepID=A0A3F2RNE0_9STRA|nr:hypothetical protein G195_007388 [Phytophthora kernoviae 00238/432]KAG2522808.1 hypothetical protein JM18_005954 [Phytophthora kernoviae]KAG2528720.1 hypothetical protein JM16_002561 [Phytophthora kernoviae]RLN37948.1 hypothetical protein BBI17_002946 [Phytophthora kernoviae]RLN53373.1 hypothetical protein BBJ29_006287 [Phytophthora kernoviae]
MRTFVDKEVVQRFVAAVATTDLSPLLSEPQNGRTYCYGGVPPGSGDPTVLELPRAYQVLLLLTMAFVDYPEVPHHRVVITGSSGTGKTSFLSWVLHHLRRLEKPPVVVLDIAGFFGRIATDGEVTSGTSLQESKREFARSMQVIHFAAVVQIARNGGLVGVGMHVDDETGIDNNVTVGSRLVHMHVDSDSTFQLSGVALCSALACSLLIGADAKQLQIAHDFIDARDSYVEPREAQLFYQQVQQELFERVSTTP